MPVNYILTTFSPTMFGESASIFMRTVPKKEAKELIGSETQIVATRESHENLAKNLFGPYRVIRSADLSPDRSAILIHYRGPPVQDDGHTPKGAVLTYYLIEVEEYHS